MPSSSTPAHSGRGLRAVILSQARQARAAGAALRGLTRETKDAVLRRLATHLKRETDAILRANRKDVRTAARVHSAAFVDRLTLTPKRIDAMIASLHGIIALPDPVGNVVAGWRTGHGLEIRKVRVPLGVVGFIFESRPNVTMDAAGLAVKSGNALILKGGKEAAATNEALVRLAQRALAEHGLPREAVQLIPGGREGAKVLMGLRGEVDVLIPRGSHRLIQTVVRSAKVPTVETGVGNCHVYVDEWADTAQALAITVNAKVQRPSVCNAAETLLVHRAVADNFLPKLKRQLDRYGVEWRGCPHTQRIVPGVKKATRKDWATEYLDLILAVRVVGDFPEALAHIRAYSSLHTEAIVTQDLDRARIFAEEVDAACVMINASTRFCDGYEFGLGAEVGISTQKVHARGPMGLEALTSTKFVVYGRGHVRQG